jgi:RNA polymerase sigma-70 factor, ECF subfamily
LIATFRIAVLQKRCRQSPSEACFAELTWADMDPADKELRNQCSGNNERLTELITLVYDELRRLASFYLRSERPGHTLQTTALVHEAYLRLAGQRQARWENRSQFFAIAAQQMRRILVDHARGHGAPKRGGATVKVSLDDAVVFSREPSPDVLAVDESLTKLFALDPEQARITELRFFGGLTIEETAEVIGISVATVKREWTMAKAWLTRELRNARRVEQKEHSTHDPSLA